MDYQRKRRLKKKQKELEENPKPIREEFMSWEEWHKLNPDLPFSQYLLEKMTFDREETESIRAFKEQQRGFSTPDPETLRVSLYRKHPKGEPIPDNIDRALDRAIQKGRVRTKRSDKRDKQLNETMNE